MSGGEIERLGGLRMQAERRGSGGLGRKSKPGRVRQGIVRLVLLLATQCLATNVSWAVNKCVDTAGRVSYSDMPCEPGSAVVGRFKGGRSVGVVAQPVPVVAAESSASSAAPTTAPTRTEQMQAYIAKGQLERKRSDLRREIELRTIDIEILLRQQEQELQALRAAKRHANSNLAGAVYESSISEEMKAVAAKYSTKIRVEQARLDQARAELAALK